MARSTLARMGTVVLFAATLAACDRTPTGTTANGILPPGASLARGSSNGNGKGVVTTGTQPNYAISPTQLSLAVGQQGIVRVTFWDKQGNVMPVTDGTGAFFGCRKLVDTDPECRSIISLLPGGINNEQATITGLAPGTVEVYAGDGVGPWVTSRVTVQ